MPDAVLRVGGYAPRESSHSSVLGVLAREIETRTEGRLGVSILWNILDEGLPATALLDMVEKGELAMCYFSTSYLGDRVSDLNVLETPFLFDTLEAAHRALDGRLGAALTRSVERQTGFQVLGYWDNGFRHLTNCVRPVRVPEDCRGLRVRLQPNSVHEAMIEAWGGIPVPVELRRGIEMIRSGEVDAQENPLANTVAYGVDRVHRFATMTAHLYGARGVFAHPGTLAGLPADGAHAVREAVSAAIAHQRREAEAGESWLRRRLEAEGMEFVDPTAEGREAFRDAVAGVIVEARRRLGDELFELAGA
ncbi:MAG TPA: TRAP transporter substrate-binding protein [Acidimicrobiia bacterium]